MTSLVTAALAVSGVPVSAGAASANVGDLVAERLSTRLFPLFDALGRKPDSLARIKGDASLAVLLGRRLDRQSACADDAACLARAMIWTDEEAKTLAAAMAASDADDDAAAQALRELQGVNMIVRTYGLGHVPPYPKIDGAGMIDPQEARSRVQAAAWLARTPRARSVQMLDPSIDFALALLDGSGRLDAIGYEPLLGGLNAAAARRAKGIDWKTFRYSAMIVTGVGPEVENMALSPYGKYHLRLAAARYAKGDIPFLILTGGRAHPRATRFTEAEEMRRALIERYGVPADAIFIEPYARHTTTNLRNAARMLMAIDAPMDKDALIVCNPDQSAMIASPPFVTRNQHELGYQPGTVGRRISPTELEFRPSPSSARVDPRDPLDP